MIAPNGEEDWFDDEGNFTDSGIAVLGTYLNELEGFKQGYADTMAELYKYSDAYEGNEAYYESLGIHSEQEYYDKVEELTDQQYDYAKSISDTEQSVVDMYESNIDAVEEYTETLIDSYNDYIDSVKEALDAERDLFDFKKNVQKQSKDIAAIERRIASLSGSTNAADVAERRKLEAQLYESRESLNDTYYDHAKDAQSEALSAEATAYEETMVKFIEGLRTSLNEATADMDTFLASVTVAASMNADVILEKYEGTGVLLDPAITNPWVHAAEKVGAYGNDATALMDAWKKDGYFSDFSTQVGTNLTSPWTSGANAVEDFRNSVASEMAKVTSNIESNVKKAKDSLASLTGVITTTDVRANGTTGSNYNDSSSYVSPPKQYRYTATIPGFVGKGKYKNSIADAQTDAQQALYNVFAARKQQDGIDPSLILGEFNKAKFRAGGIKFAAYAKGTAGTKYDEWAITDESWIGEEITLAAGKNGQLQYLKKGSAVMPADISANLVEWGKLNPNMMSAGVAPNINMINNAVNKPEFNFTFDALVKAERIDENTLPEVKKFVQQEINSLVKQMNYAIKGKGGR